MRGKKPHSLQWKDFIMGQLEVQDSNMLVSTTSQALSSMNILQNITGERVGGGRGEGGWGPYMFTQSLHKAVSIIDKPMQKCELLQLGTVPHVFILRLHDIVTYKIMNRPSSSVFTYHQ